MDSGMYMPDPAVMNLPLSDINCVLAGTDCIAYYAALNASQAATPFARQTLYGRYTAYYWVVVLFLSTIFYHGRRVFERRSAQSQPGNGRPQPSLTDKIVAVVRSLSYRNSSSQRHDHLSLPSWGMTMLLLISTGFLAALVFFERPYYRQYLGFGGPPIAIRTGFMAFALTPLLVALAGKANFISMLTGVSHERLNLVHRWVGWATFVLAWIHTIPFFIASDANPGDSEKIEFYTI